jgi:helix-turn-helix protein
MSQLDTKEILLNVFYQRKFYNISHFFEGLNRDTNFVFLFAEADETRFAIEEQNTIHMFEITMQEKEIEKGEDESDDEEEKEVKVIIEPQIKLIWWCDGLDQWR